MVLLGLGTPKFRSAEWGEPSTEDCSLPVPHQGLRAPPAGIAAWPRPRRAQQTRSASSCAPSMWHDAWAGRRPRTGADPGAACAPAAAAPCAASSPADLRRSRMRCSFAGARVRRAPNAGAKPSLRPARSRAPGRRRPRACRPGTAASVAACAGACGTGWAAHGRPGARRPRLLAFQASCAPAPSSRDSCPEERGPRCRLAYAGLIGRAWRARAGGGGGGLGGPITAPWGPCRHGGHPQLPGQRECARCTLVRL